MRRIILNLAVILVLAVTSAAMLTGNTYANSCTDTPAKQQVYNGITTTGGNCNDSGVTGAISAAVQILSIVVGVAAVITIIWGGFKYITSGGDPNKVANAKNTLIYALIGIAIAVLAQLIVNIVITQASHVP